MEHEQHLIVQWVNALLDPVLLPLVARFPVLEKFGLHPEAGQVVPDYLAMSLLIVLAFLVFGLIIRSRLSVENPGRGQIVLEEIVGALVGLLDEWVGPKG